MKKINWRHQSDNPKDLLCVKERAAYASSNAGIAFSYCLSLTFMSFYYTDVVGLSAQVVGTIFLISRVFDGFTDILMGWIVDKTKTRLGKARPWILLGALPHALATILAFAVPADWLVAKQYLYVFVTYNVLNAVTYTMTSVPIYAANCLITDSPEEHSRSGIWMQVGWSAVLFFIQFSFLGMVGKFGNDSRAWTMAAAVYALMGAGLMIFSGLVIRERVVPSKAEVKIPLRIRLKAVLSNKYWILYTLTWLVSATMYYLIDAGRVYYAEHVLGDSSKYVAMATTQSVVSLIFLVFVMRWTIKKLGNVMTNVLSFVFFLLGCLIQIFTVSWPIIIFGDALKGVGMAMNLGAQGGLMADACNYGSKKAGFDVSGMGNAGISFGSKVGMGLGGVIMGGVLGAAGYDGMAATQTTSALQGINHTYLILPIVTAVICMLLMVPFDLYKKVSAGEAEI